MDWTGGLSADPLELYTVGSPLGSKAQTLSSCDTQFYLENKAWVLLTDWHVASLPLEPASMPSWNL